MGNSTLISGAHTTLRLSGFPTLICVPLSLTVYRQDPLFSEVSDGFGQLLALVEKLVNIYNEALAGDIERSERLLIEPGEGQNQSPLTIDLAGLVETVQGSAREQVAYLVDMAKADALDLLGETRQAFELVERHV